MEPLKGAAFEAKVRNEELDLRVERTRRARSRAGVGTQPHPTGCASNTKVRGDCIAARDTPKSETR